MKGYLLDTSILIALLWPSHSQHDIAARWFARHRSRRWATCPITEAGFVRIVSNPAFSRDAVTPREALGVLTANTVAPDHDFWADEAPFAGTVAYAGTRLLGHQQVTDAYLLGLACTKGGMLATLDASIVSLTEPKSVQRKAVEVIG